MLRRELRMKGVDTAVIEKAFEELGETFNERSLLAAVAERRAGHLQTLDPLTKKRRLYEYLLRRGFRRDQVREIIEKY